MSDVLPKNERVRSRWKRLGLSTIWITPDQVDLDPAAMEADWRDALERPCPKCDALEGILCIGPSGPRTSHHRARYRAGGR